MSGDKDGEILRSTGRFSRKDLLKAGGVSIAGAALFGVTGCASQEAGETRGGGGLVNRGDIHIEMPTHMIPADSNTAIMQNGAEQAAKDMGVDVKFHGPNRFSIPEIQQIFEASIAMNPSGIAATLPDTEALGPSIREAVDQGIPVVIFNAGLDDWEELGALTYVGQTEYEAGVAAGERMAEAGVSTALCINQLQGQQVLEQRCQGFEEGLGGSVKQVAVQGGDPTAERNGIETALQQNPDTEGLLTLAPGTAEQMLRAVEAQGMRGSVQLATFDISPTVLEAVRNGEMLFAIDQQMFMQTYLSVAFLVPYIQYRRSPVAAVPSGPNFVTAQDAQELMELSAGGFV